MLERDPDGRVPARKQSLVLISKSWDVTAHACPGPKPPQGCSRQARRLFGGACREQRGPLSAKDPIWKGRLTHNPAQPSASVIQAGKDLGGVAPALRCPQSRSVFFLSTTFKVVCLNFLPTPFNIVLFHSTVLCASYIGTCHRGDLDQPAASRSRCARSCSAPRRLITATPSLLSSALPARKEEERRRGEKSQNKKNGV